MIFFGIKTKEGDIYKERVFGNTTFLRNLVLIYIFWMWYNIFEEYCHRSPKLSSKSERILLRADTLICQAQAPYFVKAKAA